jgi:glycine cleavage system H protein
MNNPDYPDDRLYSDDHEWIAMSSPADLPTEPARIGISRLAADNLGDLVYLDLPDVGSEVTAGQPCGEVESTKTVSELFAPVTGTVTEVNADAIADPAIVTSDPYGQGWLFAVQVRAPGPLLTATEYTDKNGLNA